MEESNKSHGSIPPVSEAHLRYYIRASPVIYGRGLARQSIGNRFFVQPFLGIQLVKRRAFINVLYSEKRIIKTEAGKWHKFT